MYLLYNIMVINDFYLNYLILVLQIILIFFFVYNLMIDIYVL